MSVTFDIKDEQVTVDIQSPDQATLEFKHPQPDTTWVIEHNQNRYPAVTITDNSGNVVMADVRYVDLNTVNVSFSSAFAGVAYLN